MSSNSTSSGLKKFENGFIRISGNRLLLTLRDTFVLVAATTMIAGFGIMIQNVIVDRMNGLISRSWATWQQSGFEHGLQTVGNLIAMVSNGILNFFRVASNSNFQLDSLNQILQRQNRAHDRCSIWTCSILYKNVGKAIESGVKLALGTDAGTFMNPLKDTAKELTELTKAGASNYQALCAAGLGSAELLKIDQDYGSLEVGKYADFLVLEDNPLKDVSAVEQADKQVYQHGERKF